MCVVAVVARNYLVYMTYVFTYFFLFSNLYLILSKYIPKFFI